MTFTTWLALVTICVLGAVSPGPSLALIIRNTVSGGIGQGLATAVGHGIGVGFYALITAMGLGVLVTETPWLFSTIQYAGAAFLLYLAVQIFRSSGDPNDTENNGQNDTKPPRFAGFGGGFLVAFLNPKLALFFLALFSQFVSADQAWSDQLLMMLTAGGIDALWYALVALGIGRTGLLELLKRNGTWVDRLSAVIFILLAGVVLAR